MSMAAKQRINSATSKRTGKRCLIENTDESNSVVYARCFSKVDEKRTGQW